MSKPVISCAKNGPMIVKGLENLINSDGTRLDTKPAMGLCRCGASHNKPFCDGSHKEAGFDDTVSPERTDDRLDSYPGKEITIHNNVLQLESVFLKQADNWVNPDGASAEQIRILVEQCPSGALSYSINGQPQPEIDREAAISIEKDGPLRITGGIELKDADWGQGASREHYTLCRCGASRNKPFCDGSHTAIEFDDSKGI